MGLELLLEVGGLAVVRVRLERLGDHVESVLELTKLKAQQRAVVQRLVHVSRRGRRSQEVVAGLIVVALAQLEDG